MEPYIVKEPARGIYLLPNLLTSTALFAGFYAVIQILKGRLEISAIAIFIAMIADSLDGRVARYTQTQTAFGAEYDSLSDLLCFGIAPALLAFQWSLFHLGSAGWIVAFLYTAATALRLARFNTQIGMIDKNYFQGLPSPAGAAVVAGFVWIAINNHWHVSHLVALLFGALVIATGVLMVSRVRYHSFKQFHWQDRVPFVGLLLVVLIFAFISLSPSNVIFSCAMIFAISGPVMTLWRLRKRRQERKHHEKHK